MLTKIRAFFAQMPVYEADRNYAYRRLVVPHRIVGYYPWYLARLNPTVRGIVYEGLMSFGLWEQHEEGGYYVDGHLTVPWRHSLAHHVYDGREHNLIPHAIRFWLKGVFYYLTTGKA